MEINTIANLLLELCPYLSNLGYHADTSVLEQLFILVQNGFFDGMSWSELEDFIRPLVVKDKERDISFSADFRSFLSKKNEISEEDKLKSQYEINTNRIKKELENIGKNIQKAKSNLDRKSQKDMEKVMNLISEETREQLLSEMKNVQSEFNKLNGLPEWKKLKKVLQGKTFYTEEQIDNMLNDDMYKKAISSPKAIEIMDFLSDVYKMLEMAEKEYEKISAQKEKLQNKLYGLEEAKLNQEKALEKEQAQFAKQMEILLKNESIKHRKDFIGGKAVQSVFAGEKRFLEKDFSKLSQNEKERIELYIKENAQRFRTRISKRIYTNNRHKLDMKNTVKKACATNGIPLQLIYQKPVRRKSKLVLFLDVSGSCKEASELMLTFAFYIRELFPGGCKLYAFTNRLYDISGIMTQDSASSIKNVLEAIPRSGAYSNYYIPLRDFYEHHMDDITKDSLLFFIGDARNNKNESGEEFLKEMCRKSRSAYWMNTETVDKWGHADSIIDTYSPYMRKVGQITNAFELINFICQI